MVDCVLAKLNLLHQFCVIDSRLIELAISGHDEQPNFTSQLQVGNKVKIGSLNNNTLVCYGKALFDMIVTDMINFTYGLDIYSSEDIDNIKQYMSCHDTLLNINKQLGLCDDITTYQSNHQSDYQSDHQLLT